MKLILVLKKNIEYAFLLSISSLKRICPMMHRIKDNYKGGCMFPHCDVLGDKLGRISLVHRTFIIEGFITEGVQVLANPI